tara:strand:+ start:5815 stop:5976 length:162 start_codon:yes stop_codon:yes gene_type:complete
MIEHYIIIPVAVATGTPFSVYTLGTIVGATSVTTIGLMKGIEYALARTKEKKE